MRRLAVIVLSGLAAGFALVSACQFIAVMQDILLRTHQ